MKAWNYIKNDCDQETGKEFYHNSANNHERQSRKSNCVTLGKLQDDMLSRIRRKNSINSQSAFCTRSAVNSLHFLMTGLVLLFLFEWASSPDRNIGARKKILVRLSWPLWLMCGLYVEELTRKSTMIELWLLYTDWRRTQMRGLPIWRLLMLFRGSPRCEHFGFLIQVAFSEVRKCELRLLFY